MINAVGETGMNTTWQLLSEGRSVPWAITQLTGIGSKTQWPVTNFPLKTHATDDNWRSKILGMGHNWSNLMFLYT